MAVRKVETIEDTLAHVATSQPVSTQLDEVHVTRLSARDSRRILEILDSDDEPTPALRRAKEKFERLINMPVGQPAI